MPSCSYFNVECICIIGFNLRSGLKQAGVTEQEQIGGSGGTNMRGTGREWKERSRKAIAKKGRRGANGACERKGTDAEREREV